MAHIHTVVKNYKFQFPKMSRIIETMSTRKRSKIFFTDKLTQEETIT